MRDEIRHARSDLVSYLARFSRFRSVFILAPSYIFWFILWREKLRSSSRSPPISLWSETYRCETSLCRCHRLFLTGSVRISSRRGRMGGFVAGESEEFFLLSLLAFVQSWCHVHDSYESFNFFG